ncbi:SR-related and CTD-associated factor 4-like [Ylistrum balloti]|uniref:SR-related and CTD-associated factor 4-like n=1 Tax=Ylistrum balloti TaxID=509963 RepID=UPI002905ACA6|nr:SR-related and CTD-associated factor 4-like [Ylistrum balloti]
MISPMEKAPVSKRNSQHGIHPERIPPQGIPSNGITAHGLPSNGITAHGLPSNGITPHGLPSNGITPHGLPSNRITTQGITPNGITPQSTCIHPNGFTPNSIPPNGKPLHGLPRHGKPLQGSTERDGFPVLRKRNGSGNRTKENDKITHRHVFHTNDSIPTLREVDENRPETPIVRTRRERYQLAMEGKTGNGRPIVPRDTQDVYSSNGMYKRMLASTPSNPVRSGKSGSRCPTPVPFDQPLTRLCWDNGGNKDLDTEDEDDSNYPYNPSKIPFTPRNQVTNPLFRNLKHINDVTVADIEDIHDFEKSTEHLNLTQKVLNSYFRKKMDCTQRIVKWLVDCEEKSNTSSLPAHLPNILYRNTSAHARHE